MTGGEEGEGVIEPTSLGQNLPEEEERMRERRVRISEKVTKKGVNG